MRRWKRTVWLAAYQREYADAHGCLSLARIRLMMAYAVAAWADKYCSKLRRTA